MVRDEIEELWSRLESWAATNAPGMLSELRGPASEVALDAFEAESGLTLTAGLRASLSRHDGEEGPRYCCVWADGGELLGVAEIGKAWRQARELAEQPDADEIAELQAEELIDVAGPVWAVACHARWVPFMQLNGGDRTWYLDHAPREGGRDGQVIVVDPECCTWKVEAESFEKFLEGYVSDLEAGVYPDRNDGVPTRGDAGDEGADEDLDGYDMAVVARINERTQQTTPLQELLQMEPGTEADVAGVVIGRSRLRRRYELSVWGGAIFVKGDLPKDRPEYLKVRVCVPERRAGKEPVYEVVSCEPLLEE